MKTIHLAEHRLFEEKGLKRFLLHDSPFFRILNFNLSAGQVFPVHRHPSEGQVSIHIVEGSGWFLGQDDIALPAVAGDILVSDIDEPHGVRADSDMRLLVTIAPPF